MGNETTFGCTNFLISKGATTDGSTMITYAADSHVLFGELYFRPAADYPEGSVFEVYEWDTGKFLGKIKQVKHTYSVVGNMNEYQVAIGETTYGGRPELRNPEGIIDYGGLMYITLQRAKNAREAIKVIAELMAEYGYCSSGESFSIADPVEVWIMDMIGKGEGNKGAVWVARRIPDGYISGHANQARITTFPLENGKTSISSKNLEKIFNPEIETIYAEDVISVAREKGYFEGRDKDFSFSDAYAPVNFSSARFCEARVWAAFNRVKEGMDKYLDYAMGENLNNKMPLWIKPDKKLTVHDVMELMRDYYQDTPMDMTRDIGAGPYSCIIRWRPLTWEVDGERYFNERATSTQQTGFSFVAQSRDWLPDPIGGILWFGVDDTYSTVYIPMYCGMTEIPWSYAVGNGSIMEFSGDAAFWVFNQVSNFAYTRYNLIIPEIQLKQRELETKFVESVPYIDKTASELFKKDEKLGRQFITDYSVNQGNNTVKEWKKLYVNLFTRFMDGNVKEPNPGQQNPKLEQPGYGKEWYRKIIEETGDKFKYKGEGH
jgi:dipeptidase